MTAEAQARCPGCGAPVNGVADRFCGQCGSPLPGRMAAKQQREPGECPTEDREHFTIRATGWLGAVCDIGRRREVNQDAAAVSATAERAVMVVCDGVSNAPRSELAALAAANASCASLRRGLSDPDTDSPKARRGSPDPLRSRIERITEQLGAAAVEANLAVHATFSDGVSDAAPPTCTLVAAVLEHNLLVTGNVGDSRAYWLPVGNPQNATQLGADDSWAQAMIAHGWDKALAESSPRAHAITRWIGAGTPNLQPTCGWLELSEPGWVLLCSDGLWNYCSDPVELTTLVAGFADTDRDPVAVCQALVNWANDQGGRDNITVVAARIDR